MPLASLATISLGIFIAGLHYLALLLELYWRYWWFDCLVHTLGGIFIISLTFTLIQLRFLPTKYYQPTYLKRLVLTIIIAWEVFGVILIGGFKTGFLLDTTLDILFGLLGATIGFYLLKSKLDS